MKNILTFEFKSLEIGVGSREGPGQHQNFKDERMEIQNVFRLMAQLAVDRKKYFKPLIFEVFDVGQTVSATISKTIFKLKFKFSIFFEVSFSFGNFLKLNKQLDLGPGKVPPTLNLKGKRHLLKKVFSVEC